jgi:hypothetical protein
MQLPMLEQLLPTQWCETRSSDKCSHALTAYCSFIHPVSCYNVHSQPRTSTHSSAVPNVQFPGHMTGHGPRWLVLLLVCGALLLQQPAVSLAASKPGQHRCVLLICCWRVIGGSATRLRCRGAACTAVLYSLRTLFAEQHSLISGPFAWCFSFHTDDQVSLMNGVGARAAATVTAATCHQQ